MPGLTFHLKDSESGKSISLEPFVLEQPPEQQRKRPTQVKLLVAGGRQQLHLDALSCHHLSSPPFSWRLFFVQMEKTTSSRDWPQYRCHCFQPHI